MLEVQNTSAPDDVSPLLSDYLDKPTLARELGRTIRTLGPVVAVRGWPALCPCRQDGIVPPRRCLGVAALT